MRLFSFSGIGVRIAGFFAQYPYSRAAIALSCTVFMAAYTAGCGMAASPQPPSLHLPNAIHDLAATRVGDRVELHWTTPKETTDKLRIQGEVQLQICREQAASPCQTIATVTDIPGKTADYADNLPPALATGPLRAMTYKVFAVNKNGRNAGPSNPAETLAGSPPPAIQHLSATTVERGVLLQWQTAAGLQPNTSIQLQRTLLTPADARNGANAREPIEQTLRVVLENGDIDPGMVLDTDVVFGRQYRYKAARVSRLSVGGVQLQISSTLSPPAIVFTRDTFPPAIPAGLVAVPVSVALNGGKPEIDLSWTANTEPDLAGYIVYRRSVGMKTPESASTPDRLATVVTPAFRDMNIQIFHTFVYWIVAVDRAGNRSGRSKEITVTIPGP